MSFAENLWKSGEIIYPSKARVPLDSQHLLYRKMKSYMEASIQIDVRSNKMAQAACRRMSRLEVVENNGGVEVKQVLEKYSKVYLPSGADDANSHTNYEDDMYSEGEIASDAEVRTLCDNTSDMNSMSHNGSKEPLEELTGQNSSTKVKDTNEDAIKQKPGPDTEYSFRGKSYPVPIQQEFHSIIFNFTNSNFFTGFILSVILLNTIILVVSTSYVVRVHVGWYFSLLDNVFLGIYIMEIVLKIYSWRSKFFMDGWNLVDFTIVVFNLIEFILPLIIQNMKGFNGVAILRFLRVFKAIRAIRALRVLRTIRFLSNLQVIMSTVVNSIRSIGAIVILITMFMYMFAVIGRGLYAENDPAHFGNLYLSFFTMFQLLTMDDWFEIYEAVINSDPGKWHIIIYLLLYIVVENLIFLNLFVAVLVDNFQLLITAEMKKKKQKASETKSSDEEYAISEEQLSTCFTDSEDDDERKERKNLNTYNPGLDDEQNEDLNKYFQLLTAIEYNHHMITEQNRLIDQMVDICGDM